MVLHGIYLPVEQTTAHVTYLGELTGLFPLLGLLPRGGSFTKFRHDASLFSRACKTNEIKITTCPSIHQLLYMFQNLQSIQQLEHLQM